MRIRATTVFLFLLIPCGTWGQDWRFYGADSEGTRFSSLQQINRENVHALKRVWSYHTGEVDRENETDRHRAAPFETTPLVVDGTLYLSTPSNRVIALDAETGTEIWQFDPQAGAPVENSSSIAALPIGRTQLEMTAAYYSALSMDA